MMRNLRQKIYDKFTNIVLILKSIDTLNLKYKYGYLIQEAINISLKTIEDYKYDLDSYKLEDLMYELIKVYKLITHVTSLKLPIKEKAILTNLLNNIENDFTMWSIANEVKDKE